jgi:hypothetical protein
VDRAGPLLTKKEIGNRNPRCHVHKSAFERDLRRAKPFRARANFSGSAPAVMVIALGPDHGGGNPAITALVLAVPKSHKDD